MTDTPSTAARIQRTEDDNVRTARAHVFFWSELSIAAGVSIAGNAAQAVLHTTALPAVAAAVAIIPPLALLAAVHGVILLARAHTVSPAAHRTATLLTVVIAGGAFWLSFTALRSLAITAGVPTAEAWLWPLIVEGSMTQSTIALLTLARAHQPREPNLEFPASTHIPDLTSEPISEPPRPVVPTISAPDNPPPLADTNNASACAHLDFAALAVRICEQDPGRRRDPDTVTTVLSRRYVDGWTASRISRELGCSRSSVSRILRDANSIRVDARPHTSVELVRDGAHVDASPIS
ncbi:DUF2637 domain-containing protein [Nocardia salmonicida]|uniref:DUF2637 domain-containing protein n=1 Tax=Nocardia salmonicida TaxID=53431 RepID=UPI0033EFD8DE